MDVFVARQPIFDANSRVRAYELLYRSADTPSFDGAELEPTSKLLVNAALTVGLDTLTSGRPAHINFSGPDLVRGFPLLLPPHSLVVEVLETVEPSPDVLAACRELRSKGYTLALDDVDQLGPEHRGLLELVDIVKVDFLATDAVQRRRLATDCRGRELLAEKVETFDDFTQARWLGYTRFQGFFFCRPNVVAGRDVPAHHLSSMRLMREVCRPEVDLAAVELMIKADVALSYKLLRYVNSAAFGWRRRIEALRPALVALGEAELRRWVSMVCLGGISQHKPLEMAVQCLIRAHFCEALGALSGLWLKSADLFLVGLFSGLDALLNLPLERCLEQVPLPDPVRAALAAGEGPMGTILGAVLAYERGAWDEAQARADELGIEVARIPETYVHAVQLADSMFASEEPQAPAGARRPAGQ